MEVLITKNKIIIVIWFTVLIIKWMKTVNISTYWLATPPPPTSLLRRVHRFASFLDPFLKLSAHFRVGPSPVVKCITSVYWGGDMVCVSMSHKCYWSKCPLKSVLRSCHVRGLGRMETQCWMEIFLFYFLHKFMLIVFL
jgi:hypothetical protein